MKYPVKMEADLQYNLWKFQDSWNYYWEHIKFDRTKKIIRDQIGWPVIGKSQVDRVCIISGKKIKKGKPYVKILEKRTLVACFKDSKTLIDFLQKWQGDFTAFMLLRKKK